MPFTQTEREELYQDIKKALQHQFNEALYEEQLISDEVYHIVQWNLDSKGD